MSRIDLDVDFTLKEGNTAPPFEVQVLTGLREVVNLTGATNPRFAMWNRRTRTVVIDAAAQVTDPATGLVSYSWQGTDTATPGRYEAEFTLELPGGEGRITIPPDGYFQVEILPEIG